MSLPRAASLPALAQKARRLALGLGLGIGVGGTAAASAADSSPRSEISAERATHGGRQLELVQVQVLFRHGARTNLFEHPDLDNVVWNKCGRRNVKGYEPLEVRNVDGGDRPPLTKGVARQYAQVYPGGCKGGQLTDLGKLQAEELGDKIACRYPGIMESLKDDPRLLYVRSTNFPRTIETASHVLKGLSDGRNWLRHVVIETVHGYKESMVGTNVVACPRLKDYFKEAKQAYGANPPPEARRIRSEMEAKLGKDKCLTMKIGEADDWNGYNVVLANDILKTMVAHGMDLPDWGSHVLARDCYKMAGKQISFLLQKDGRDDNFRKQVSRLGIGRFLQHTYDCMALCADENKNGKDTSSKLRLYSGHDTSVMPTLIAYQIFDGHWPTFCSTVTWELHRDTSNSEDYFVRVLYDFKPMLLPTPSGMHGNSFIHLNEFKALTERITPKDFKQECRVSGPIQGSVDVGKF